MGNSLSLKNHGPRNFLLLLPLPKHYILYIHHQSHSACSDSECTRNWMKPRIIIIMWSFMGSRLTSSTRCMSTSTKALNRLGWWDHVSPASKDPITGVTEAFLADTNPHKINLGVVHFFLIKMLAFFCFHKLWFTFFFFLCFWFVCDTGCDYRELIGMMRGNQLFFNVLEMQKQRLLVVILCEFKFFGVLWLSSIFLLLLHLSLLKFNLVLWLLLYVKLVLRFNLCKFSSPLCKNESV